MQVNYLVTTTYVRVHQRENGDFVVEVPIDRDQAGNAIEWAVLSEDLVAMMPDRIGTLFYNSVVALANMVVALREEADASGNEVIGRILLGLEHS